VSLSGLVSHAARGSVAKTPYFLETISCLAVIMGETGDSGPNPGFEVRGNSGESRAFSERFTRWDGGVVPDQGSGPKTGDFREQDSSSQPLLRREVRCARPPLPKGKIPCLAVILGETGW